MSDKLLEEVLNNRSLHDKWKKVKKRRCPNGQSDYKGARCPCQECFQKRSLYLAYAENKKMVDKLKYQAKVAFFGGKFNLYLYLYLLHLYPGFYSYTEGAPGRF